MTSQQWPGARVGGGGLISPVKDMYGSQSTFAQTPPAMGYAQSPSAGFVNSPGMVYDRSPANTEGYVQEGYGYGYGSPQSGWTVQEVKETVMVPETQMVAQVVMVPREVRRMIQTPIMPVAPQPAPYHETHLPPSTEPRAPNLLARDEPLTPKTQRVQRSAPPPPPSRPENDEEDIVPFMKKQVSASRSAPAPEVQAERIVERKAQAERIVEREVQVDRIVEKVVEVPIEIEKEKIVYKDVPVPVHMSNERVIVKEVPVPVEVIKEVQVPIEKVHYQEVLMPTEQGVPATSGVVTDGSQRVAAGLLPEHARSQNPTASHQMAQPIILHASKEGGKDPSHSARSSIVLD